MTDRLDVNSMYVAVLVIHDLCHAVGDAREILADIGGKAILVRALWKRWRMSGGLRWDERSSVLVVLLLCHPW
jgi:hypothetical protein